MEIPHYWNNELFNTFECSRDVSSDSNKGSFLVKGSLKSPVASGVVKFIASNPADFRQSYSGSGLPFPNPEIAYENTQNKGSARVTNGNFEFYIQYPNSLYINQGTTLLSPHVLVKLCDSSDENVEVVVLGDGIPHRTLTSSTFTRSSFKKRVYPMHNDVNPNYYH